MGLFRRRKDSSGSDRAEAILDFWVWWAAGGAAAVDEGLTTGEPRRVVPELAAHVHAMDPNLAWELGAGMPPARHLLVVTADGNSDLRPLVRRWWLAAPPPDATWSFADTRQATPDPDSYRIQLGAWDIDAARALVDARVRHAAVHVSVYHPDFHHLDEGTRHVAASLLLDALLGESDAEVWVGEVAGTDIPPLDPVPLVGLRAVVRDLKSDHVTLEGELRWAVFQGSAPDGSPVLAAAQVPLRPGTAPQLDSHVAVVVPFSDVTDEGMPGPGSVDSLRRLEEHIGTRLGHSGQVVAHQSSGGRRIMHAYLDSTTPALAQLRAAVTGWDQGRVEVSKPVLDPDWEHVAHLR